MNSTHAKQLTNKYKDKYRTTSHRMPKWDYSHHGFYFITLVTQNRVCNLGEIINKKMILSHFGKIIKTEWDKSFKMRDELFCDKYIIMPNHLHAIVKTHGRASLQQPIQSPVKTHGRASLQDLIRQPQSISSFIAGFKSGVNSKIDNYIDDENLNISKYNRTNHFFQPNYHDHIIRDENEYQHIMQYIIDNPIKWENDKLNGETGNIIMEPTVGYDNESWMV